MSLSARELAERGLHAHPVTEVLIRSSTGQIQFRIWVEAPRSRVDEELLPLLHVGGAEERWTADATGRGSEVHREDD